jgi:hypothetical protein
MADSNQNTGLQIPLLPELQLVKAGQDMLGMGGSSGSNVNFTPTAGIPQLTAQDMNAIIQNFLRTDGQFLNKALAQNRSGMYNSTSRASMSKELLAQAALKAVQANTQIATSNAAIASANAAGARAAAGNGEDAETRKRRARQQLGLAAGIHYLRSPGGGAAVGGAWDSTKDFLGFGNESLDNLFPMSGVDELPFAADLAPAGDMAAFNANSAANLMDSFGYGNMDLSFLDFAEIPSCDFSGAGQDLGLAEGPLSADWESFSW